MPCRQRSVKKTNAWSARPFVVLFKVCLTDLNQETVKLSKERQIGIFCRVLRAEHVKEHAALSPVVVPYTLDGVA